MELGHLPYKKGTYEDYVGERGLKRRGKAKWRLYVNDVVALLVAALEPTDVVLGGGNLDQLKDLPPGCRAGDNAYAFLGGFRLWERAGKRKASAPGRLAAADGERASPAGKQVMTTSIAPLTRLPVWKALHIHCSKVGDLHLRKLFADDTKRGERFTAEAVGIYLDYSPHH
jgi:hypothetical protein